jgi:hypothetical protein
VKLGAVAAGFFLSAVFGFLRSRLLRFCPLAKPALPRDQMRPSLSAQAVATAEFDLSVPGIVAQPAFSIRER